MGHHSLGRDEQGGRAGLAQQPGRQAGDGKPRHRHAAHRVCLGVKCDLLRTNPTTDVEPLRENREGWRAWPPAALERFAQQATGAPRIAFFLALYTGQRRADVLALRWDAVDLPAGEIHLRQAKTGVELWIPIHPALRAELERERRDQAERQRKRKAKGQAAAVGLTVVQKLNGQPYHEDGFGTLWNRAQHDCECAGLPYHGLRKNATNALFEAGATPQQVQAITSHALEMVQHYGRDADKRRLAKEAMRLWARDGKQGEK